MPLVTPCTPSAVAPWSPIAFRSSEPALFAAFANRMLSENVCEAVFDGGAPQPFTAHFERAEEQFTVYVGADGEVSRAPTNNFMATATLRFSSMMGEGVIRSSRS